MILTNPEEAERGRHPWLTSFAANPRVETARLLTGFAAIDPYRRADAPDAADLIFGPLPVDDPSRRALGDALVAWLMERRGMLPEQRAAYGIDPFVREVSDAFRIVSRLELVDAARRLRGEFHQWDVWTRPLMLTPARDARRAYLRFCALMQTALGDDRLEPVWLDLCGDAGRALFDAYLSVGLLGLRRMPAAEPEPGFEPARRVALGLAVWARAKRPSRDDFMREWRAIKCLYPRTKGAWHDIVDAAIEAADKEADGTFQAATWWRKDIGPQKQPRPQRRETTRPPLEPVKEATKRLKREPLTTDLVSTLNRLVDERERYAIATGDNEFILKTACNFATELLSHRWRGARLAHNFVRRALNWNNDYDYAWALWHQVVEAEGDLGSAELLAWEALRRFPHQADKRNLLARFLAADPLRRKEAEALLQETIKRFPTDEYARNQLAEILAADPSRRTEAKALLRETIKLLQSETATDKLLRSEMATRNLLAGLLLQEGRTEEAGKELDNVARIGVDPRYFALRQRWAYRISGAEAARTWLEKGLNQFPSNPVLRRKLDKISGAEATGDEDDDWLALLFGALDEGEQETLPGAAGGHGLKAAKTSIEPDEAPSTASDTPPIGTPREAPGLIITKHSAEERSTVGPSAETWIWQGEPVERMSAATADLAYVDALRYGRARRADFALNGAGLDETGRADARADLEAVLKEDQYFVYARLVALRRLDDDPGETVWDGLGRQDAIAIARAWRAGQLRKLHQLARHSTEQLLARCAAALAGDDDARASFAESIVRGSRAEGRGSRILRRSLEMPLKAYGEPNDGPPRLEPASAQRLFEDQPELVTHALTEAIDASFDYRIAQA